MKIGFSKLSIVLMITFLLAFISIMLTYVSPVFVYVTLALLFAGFAALSVILIIKYKKFTKNLAHDKQELLMELSVTEDGEKYVMANSPYNKAQTREIKARKMDKLIPIILTVTVSVLFLYLFIMQFIPK